MGNSNVGDDLKAMAQDVADLGAGYMRMGRRWLEMQRQQVSGEAARAASPEATPEQGGEHGTRGGYGHPRGEARGGHGRADACGVSYRGVGPKNYVRSDQRITEDLCESLTRDERVDPSDISVTVSGGVVSLAGTVRARWMKHRIEDLAAACEGVRSVENNIQLPAAAPSAGSPAAGTNPPDDPVM
ncbi:MAG: BON domain-containing protein [Lysobacter sp.]